MNPWEVDDEIIDDTVSWGADDEVVGFEEDFSTEPQGSALFPASTAAAQEGMTAANPMQHLNFASDVYNIPTRFAAEKLRGMEMEDQDAYAFRPETERYKEAIDEFLPENAPFTRGVLKFGTELIGRTISDPVSYAGPLGAAAGGIRSGLKTAASRLTRPAAASLKRGVSDLSQIPPELLDRASTPEGLREISEAARRTGGGNMLPEAQDLAQRVEALNRSRQGLAEGSRARQLTQFEEELSGALNRPGVLGATPSRGADIPLRIDASKAPMQEAYLAGDKASVGPLRERGVSKTVYRGEKGRMASKKDVTSDLADVLREFKALSPDQGVPKITRGASGALKSILGMAEKQANSIDDLINLKGQLRSVRSSGGFEGNIFDASVDDLAFAKAESAINRNIERSIAKADPKNAQKIITLMRANNEQYAKTKEILSGLAGSMGKTQNTDRVISKVAALGPTRSRELIEAADKIPALRPVVDELRQGFIDDLILSANRSGTLDPAMFAKRWNDSKALSPELKSAWLTPEQIKRIDDAVSMSAQEIVDPSLIGKKLFGTAKDPLSSSSLAARRMENIGSMANRDAARELEFLDNLLGLKGKERFSEQAKDVFQARQLGMGAEGKLPLTPTSGTGRSVLGFSLGDAIGGVLGGTLGFMAGGALGASTGAAIGTGARSAGRAGVAFVQSPAGAVAANRILKRWAVEQADQVSPRAGALARALEKTTNTAVKARVLDQLKRELEKESEE